MAHGLPLQPPQRQEKHWGKADKWGFGKKENLQKFGHLLDNLGLCEEILLSMAGIAEKSQLLNKKSESKTVAKLQLLSVYIFQKRIAELSSWKKMRYKHCFFLT